MTSPELEQYVTYAVVRAAKTHLRRAGALLVELGLQPGQDMLLRQLWRQDGLSQSELLTRLMVEPPTVTKAIGRLERDGLVTRRRDRGDARVSRVFLTARGKRLRGRVEAIWAELEERATAGFTADERGLLRRLSARMRENLAVADDPTAPTAPTGAR
jgi:DNA-binding MarR family transcriptional regulator